MVIATEKTLPAFSASRVKISGNGDANSVNWLIITDQDESVMNSVSRLIGDEQAAILTSPASGWRAGDPELSNAVQWFVTQVQVGHLLVIGHSDAAMLDAGDDSIGQQKGDHGSFESSTSGYNRLLQGAKQAQNKIQCGKKAFARQVIELTQMPDVQAGIVDGKLKLHALYYVAESGTFLLFNAANETFEPLACS